METGLVQSRQQFILPDDAYPVLENAFVWRERIKRKKGCELLGRLRRVFTAQALGNMDGAGDFSGNLVTIFSLESTATFEVGSIVANDGINTYTDNGLGVLVGSPGGSGTINYATGDITLAGGLPSAGAPITISFKYYPGLPVMGLLSREQDNINNEEMVAFDTKYAYIKTATGFIEFITGTTWTGTDYNFFWPMNYWKNGSNQKLFWVTNFSGPSGDPIRYTDGVTWTNFSGQIDNGAPPNFIFQSLAMVPFRSRMVVFNTWEGPTLAGSTSYQQRIRWAQIGNPLTADAWRDDIPGKGGFLDIPTAEAIVSVGFVRDNLVIYCERSTWQLRYTGRSISPFQIEKVNSELGAESPFSAIQFDTSLVGIGDKGIVECDSFKSERIDIKIPDLVFQFTNTANGPQRVYGLRDFEQRLAYWTYPYQPGNGFSTTYPNRRLVYNYENDSWAIFTDSFTCFGTYQPPTSRRWSDFASPIDDEWINQNDTWTASPALTPLYVAGNQQGFVEILDKRSTNDETLYIENITGNTTTATTINSPNHNLVTGQIIKIFDIPTGTPFDTLNEIVFMVDVIDSANFNLYKYNSISGTFSTPQVNDPATYIGGGVIAIRDNFIIQSKKFNFLEDGENIQLGFIDILMNATEQGAISLNVYLDYNETSPVNIPPQNSNPSTLVPDTFFNNTVPTTSPNPSSLSSSKYWQRVFCPVRGAFITIVWTLSPKQMNGPEQEEDVQIDSQILWLRKAGRQLPIGV